jgi:hypothetical protein
MAWFMRKIILVSILLLVLAHFHCSGDRAPLQ